MEHRAVKGVTQSPTASIWQSWDKLKASGPKNVTAHLRGISLGPWWVWQAFLGCFSVQTPLFWILPLPTGRVKTDMLVLMTSPPRSQLTGQGWFLLDDVSSGLS